MAAYAYHAEVLGYEAVSYTHLDVYKRQELLAEHRNVLGILVLENVFDQCMVRV